jgi:hypothetical protein
MFSLTIPRCFQCWTSGTGICPRPAAPPEASSCRGVGCCLACCITICWCPPRPWTPPSPPTCDARPCWKDGATCSNNRSPPPCTIWWSKEVARTAARFRWVFPLFSFFLFFCFFVFFLVQYVQYSCPVESTYGLIETTFSFSADPAVTHVARRDCGPGQTESAPAKKQPPVQVRDIVFPSSVSLVFFCLSCFTCNCNMYTF